VGVNLHQGSRRQERRLRLRKRTAVFRHEALLLRDSDTQTSARRTVVHAKLLND